MATTVKLGAQTETALEATLIECAPGSAVVAKADEQPPGERKNVDESGQYSLPDRVMQAVTLGSNCGEAEEERTVENHHDTRPMDCSSFSETAEIG